MGGVARSFDSFVNKGPLKEINRFSTLGASTGVTDMWNMRAPGAPQFGDYPGLSPEELDALKKQNLSLDELNRIIGGDAATIERNKSVLSQISGLVNADGTVNQARLDSLKQRTQQHIDLSNEIGDKALGYLQSYFGQGGPGGAPSGQQAGIQDAENQSYLDALQGKYKASVGLKQDADTQFNLLKEAAAKRGIRIDGDSFDTATSESTAGIKMISEFQKNFARSVDAEKQAVLTRGGNLNLGRVTQAQNAGVQNFQLANAVSAGGTPEQLGYFASGNQLAGDRLAPHLAAYISGQSIAAQPYGQQRANVYNAYAGQQTANYNAAIAQFNQDNALLGGIGQLAGTALGAYYGGPMGARAGGAVGGAVAGGPPASQAGYQPMGYYQLPQNLSLYNNNQAGIMRYYAN